MLFSCHDKNDNNHIENLFLFSDKESISKEERIKCLNKIEKLVPTLKSDSLKKKYYFKLANRYWNQDEMNGYVHNTKLAINYSIKANDINSMAKGYLYLGGLLFVFNY